MKPAATIHVPTEQRALQAAKGLSAEQRKALELLKVKCPAAQRDDGYDTVYGL